MPKNVLLGTLRGIDLFPMKVRGYLWKRCINGFHGINLV